MSLFQCIFRRTHPGLFNCVKNRQFYLFTRRKFSGHSKLFANASALLRNVCFRNECRRFIGAIETKRPSKSLSGSTWKDLKEIFALSAPFKTRLFLGMLFLSITSMIFMLLPRILGKFLDEFNRDNRSSDPKKLADPTVKLARFFLDHPAIFAVVLLVGSTAIAARIYCMHTAGQLVINRLRNQTFSSVIRQDMGFFDREKVGEMVSRLSTDVLIVGNAVTMNLSDGSRALIASVASAGIMVYTSTHLSKVIVFVIPLIVGSLFVFGRIQRKYTIQMQEAIAASNQLATERFSNVRTVRTLVSEDKEIAAYSRTIQEIWRIARLEAIAKGSLFGSFQLTGYSAFAVILYYGIRLIDQGLITYGDLSSFLMYAIFCATNLSGINNFYTELMKGLGASQRIFELKNRQPSLPITGGIAPASIRGDIHFESITFAYPSRPNAPVFTDLSLKMPAGKITALVGPSGCGKSTLGHLLLRLYDPDSGRICIDGLDLKSVDPSWWRRQIGVVSQEPVLFSTTIRENIAYALHSAASSSSSSSSSLVESAARQANCQEFIARFPHGLDTLLGEWGGSTLSGGQKQRVALARALLTSPPVLLLDEATSALDAASEYLVKKTLLALMTEGARTVLIIAHRLSTIKHADQIAVLDKGTVAELGTFEELITIKDGIFRKLVDKQTIRSTIDSF